MKIEFEPFNEHDWMSFAGAVGEDPSTAFLGNRAVAILDEHAVEVHFYRKRGLHLFRFPVRGLAAGAAAEVLSGLEFKKFKQTRAALVTRGFEDLGLV